ncbi:Uncharacterised protein [Mycobacteroides abscessus subsp. abscessus]|nr:Uncharacterised protein [Mycobacteroides abscessus subsp. abscessus]
MRPPIGGRQFLVHGKAFGHFTHQAARLQPAGRSRERWMRQVIERGERRAVG